MNSYFLCFYSMFRLHNETGNIHTHTLAFLFSFYLLYCTWVHDQWDLLYKIAVSVFLCSSLWAFFFSVLFHTLNCHSPHSFRCWLNWDISGVFLCVCMCSSALRACVFLLVRCSFLLPLSCVVLSVFEPFFRRRDLLLHDFLLFCAHFRSFSL